MNAFSAKHVMTSEEYELLRNLVEGEIGIVMKKDRRLTFHSKISHRLMILGLSTYRDYYDLLISDPAREELFILASHMANNESYFFREKPQLTFFARLLADIKREKEKQGQRSLRILSLASSSGEEAYTLNIIIQESGLFARDWDVRITAMDMDRNALEKARTARYTRNSFKTLKEDDDFADKYFTAEEASFALRKTYTDNMEFRHGNIVSSSSFEGLDIMDVIFCRNVLICMTEDAFGKIILNCYRNLSGAGYLFLGSSESLIQRTDLFVPEYQDEIVVYRKNPGCGLLP